MLSTEQLFLFLEGKFGSLNFQKKRLTCSFASQKIFSSVSFSIGSSCHTLDWGVGRITIFPRFLNFLKVLKTKKTRYMTFKTLSPLSDCIEGIPFEEAKWESFGIQCWCHGKNGMQFIPKNAFTESLSIGVNSKWSMDIRREDPTNEILSWSESSFRLSFFLLPTFLYATGPLHMLFSVAHNNLYSFFPLISFLVPVFKSYQSLQILESTERVFIIQQVFMCPITSSILVAFRR